MFRNIFETINTALRQMSPAVFGGIILLSIVLFLLCFAYSVKGSKGGKFIKHQFLFIISILILIFMVVFTLLYNFPL